MTATILREQHILSPDRSIRIFDSDGNNLKINRITVANNLYSDQIILNLKFDSKDDIEAVLLTCNGYQLMRRSQPIESKAFSRALAVDGLYSVDVQSETRSGEPNHKQFMISVLNAEMERLLALLLSNQHDKSSAWPMLSPERFMIYNTYKNNYAYGGKRVFVSGCGSGAEIPALLALGAAEVHAHDVSTDCLNFCRARFQHTPNVKLVEDPSANVQLFDFVISRHVIEHVPRDGRQAYLTFLCNLLKSDGHLILDVPNQDCPIEPHTDIAFFHLLTPDAKQKAVRYFETAGSEKERAMLGALKSLITHTNLTPAECTSLVPKGFKIVELVDIDPRVPSIDVEIAGTFRMVIARA